LLAATAFAQEVSGSAQNADGNIARGSMLISLVTASVSTVRCAGLALTNTHYR